MIDGWMRRAFGVGLLLGGTLWGPSALACSVCSDPNDPRSAAYFDMTIFMSLLPLLVMGTAAIWIWRRMSAEAIASSAG